jgi:hypothetical protein
MSSAGVAWEVTPRDSGTERARDFHFAVTWAALSAHLGPLHTADQIFTRSAEIQKQTTKLDLLPHASLAAIEKPRWEMVVPKMDRSEMRRLAPTPVLLPPAEVAKPAGRDLSIAKIVGALRRRQRQGKRAEIA